MQTIVHLAGGEKINLEGEVQRVAAQLGHSARSASGYCEVTDTSHRKLMINAAQVLYLEEYDEASAGPIAS